MQTKRKNYHIQDIFVSIFKSFHFCQTPSLQLAFQATSRLQIVPSTSPSLVSGGSISHTLFQGQSHWATWRWSSELQQMKTFILQPQCQLQSLSVSLPPCPGTQKMGRLSVLSDHSIQLQTLFLLTASLCPNQGDLTHEPLKLHPT